MAAILGAMRGLLVWIGLGCLAAAEMPPLVLGAPFRDHAVLQRDRPVPVWGRAGPGEVVAVSFADHRVEGRADDQGRWRVHLPALPASAEPVDLIVTGAGRSLTLGDVVVGEVWLCAGQSNMNRGVAEPGDEDPLIRQLKTKGGAEAPQETADAAWITAAKGTRGFSGCAYHLAQGLRRHLDVPIGLLVAAVDGSPLDPFLAPAGVAGDPELALLAERIAAAPETTRYWNGMVHPLAPYAIRGAAWYQGESSAMHGTAYLNLLAALVRGWRQAWEDERLPFLVVQLPNHRIDPAVEPVAGPAGDDGWTRIREAQWRAGREIPGVTTVVTIDIGDAADIHPGNKAEVGRRLALAALAEVYGAEAIPWSGPVFAEQRAADGRLVLRFDRAEGGLMVVDGGPALRGPAPESPEPRLRWFAVAGADARWHHAEARIVGEDTVEVWSEAVADPVAVRYAWRQNPEGGLLANRAGLPCAPFRSDRALTPPPPMR